MNWNRISLINTYSSTFKLFIILYINMTEYQNGEIQLANYKIGFEFVQF